MDIDDFLEALGGKKITSYEKVKLQLLCNEAIAFAKSEKFDLAIIKISEAMNIVPENQNFYLQRGFWFFEIEKYKESAQDFNSYLEVKNKKENQLEKKDKPLSGIEIREIVDVYFRFGLCCQKIGDFTNALPAYQLAIVMIENLLEGNQEIEDPNLKETYNTMRSLVLVISPLINIEQVFNNYAVVLFETNQLGLSIKYSSKAIEIKPDYINPLIIRSLCNLRNWKRSADIEFRNSAKIDLKKASDLGSPEAKKLLMEID